MEISTPVQAKEKNKAKRRVNEDIKYLRKELKFSWNPKTKELLRGAIQTKLKELRRLGKNRGGKQKS